MFNVISVIKEVVLLGDYSVIFYLMILWKVEDIY